MLNWWIYYMLSFSVKPYRIICLQKHTTAGICWSFTQVLTTYQPACGLRLVKWARWIREWCYFSVARPNMSLDECPVGEGWAIPPNHLHSAVQYWSSENLFNIRNYLMVDITYAAHPSRPCHPPLSGLVTFHVPSNKSRSFRADTWLPK